MTVIDAAVHREWIVGMGRRTAAARVAHLFCELFKRLEVAGLTKADSYNLPINQEQLSDALGLSLVHTNRILSTLRKKAAMTFSGQTVTILDWNYLARLAEFDPSYMSLWQEPR